ncbi:hypothetical protein Godav_017557 [Gossypium davidsonii]|uniref:RNase H type-1 domain-containing protein n=1 Tax=Gossypium davidsonii TaxID=34287 RepID=A0A7J8QUX3_GOSDV|nr:hypothetical protein [Gossypium davidsonii]
MVARGQNGEIAVSKSTLHSNVSSPFVAEALACLEATKLGISMGFNSVTIIGDSKTIINMCNTKARDKSVLGTKKRGRKLPGGRDERRYGFRRKMATKS